MPEVRVFRDANKRVQLFDWLSDLKRTEPPIWKKGLAYILELRKQGYRLQRPISAPLRDGIHELRPKSGHVNYRLLYFFHDEMAVITHGLTKEREVPNGDIEFAIKCRTLVMRDKNKYTATLPDDFFG